jgi:hypothetical protein
MVSAISSDLGPEILIMLKAAGPLAVEMAAMVSEGIMFSI